MNSVMNKTDVILIGGGIMSATLGTLLKEVAPEWDIEVFEKLDSTAQESSDAWNNAGTGHSALCELNYTPEQADGSLDVTKAIRINEQFQLSKQFWSHLVEKGMMEKPQDFIMPVPHLSFVEGEKNVEFLQKRVEALSKNPLFEGMEFADDEETLNKWIPLMMQERASKEPIAATRIETGTDINFGNLTRKLFDLLEEKDVSLNLGHEVEDIRRTKGGEWQVKVRNLATDKVEYHTSKFIFIGAGGGSLPLLQKTGIPESKNIGGFPVSGLFMVCENPEVVEKHNAKVYGKAKVGAPPMSVPHLDTRYIEGKKSLLFGPFAGFSPKFLKTGSYFDLIGSVKPNNVFTMLSAGAKEMGLTKYLIQQVMQSNEDRMEDLREFIPSAKSEDWDIVVAGQRVQVIKDTDKGGKGTLQFGTEVITAEDGSVAALLGASPGASVSVDVMLDVMQRCFPQEFPEWEDKIKEMVPSYGINLSEQPEKFKELNEMVSDKLDLKPQEEGALLS
ncbi:malate:quinone oxidoreductase [Salinicoccus roseus]|uniref:malate:quinone oxidoreductase n=1 Tax=Salinicoccus roseus TaxID=45670 RepID=UPI000F4FB796|nr:malate:quinone oxidoreductase [Salinicoccus roseus]MBY8909364.1 malate:quinone oxidoreductase [Salinicoccus roseus]RPE51056.1 malate dehydrogenase (quinone) [Salinicoccus roseus]GGA78358.1 putative malate:quinone oxidoreductase [Salinicoccus roseus]